MKQKVLNFLTLFTSFSTLICCALPALLVTMGMGSALAGFLSNHPEIIWLSENKIFIFIFAAICLAIGGYVQAGQKKTACPISDKAVACEDTRKLSKYIYFFGLTIYLIGLFFAFILPLFI